MIPVAPIVIALLALLRHARGGNNQPSIRGRSLSWLFYVKLFLIAPIIASAIGTEAAAPAFAPGPRVTASALVTILVLLPFILPVAILRVTTVRLGLARATYYLARATGAFASSGQFRSGAALLAAEALRRSRAPSADDIAWVARKAERAPNPATNATTTMMLEHVESATSPEALERAYALSTLLERAYSGDLVRLARGRAFSFLAAHSAARGDFARVAALRFSVATLSVRAWAVRVLARSEVGSLHRFPLQQRKVASWILGAEGRRMLEGPPIKKGPPAPSSASGAELFTEAASAHAAFLSVPSPSAANRALARWSDVVTSPATRAAWDRRKLALGARRGELDDMVHDARHAIADALLSRRLSGAELAAIDSDEVRLRVKDALWAELNDASTALRRRTDADDALSSREEWLEVARIVLLWERLMPLSTPAELYSAFSYPLDHYACWIADKIVLLRDRPLAYAAFAFLRERAVEAGATESSVRLRENMNIVRAG